jgi:hypothetical protein
MENALATSGAAQQAKQQVVSSTAYDLARAGAPVEEIRRALLPDVRRALPAALMEVREELIPAGPEDLDKIVMALGRQIGLLKAGLATEHKDDWISIATEELCVLPANMVLEALREVRRKARYEGDVIPGVLEIVEPRVSRLLTERKNIECLLEIAG